MSVQLRDAPMCTEARHDDLLLHYVDGAQRTVGSVDQLGNFLMGFGVLALGYLLNADLALATKALGVGSASLQLSAALTLGAWGTAVLLLVTFVWIYIFRVLAGRSVHASEGREANIGQVLHLPSDLSWQGFIKEQRTFKAFLHNNYRTRDQKTPESLLYARWSYMRFMTLQKLAEMQRMRALLGLALIAGVAFKVLMVYLTAVS